MSIVEILERQIEQLGPKEFAAFRNWFLEFEADAWDRQIEQAAKSGKLDALARKAMEDHAMGQTTLL